MVKNRLLVFAGLMLSFNMYQSLFCAGAGAGSAGGGASASAAEEATLPNTLIDLANYIFKGSPEFKQKGLAEPPFLETPLIPERNLLQTFEDYFTLCLKNGGNLANRDFWHTQPAADDSIDTILTSADDASTAIPFVEQQEIMTGERIIFMGDLHGGVHSLMRNLLHMAETGLLKNDLTLKPNIRLIVLGDMTDRGCYGVEVLYTLLQLKLKNWDQVTLIRGNHEGLFCTSHYGFTDEIRMKYGSINSNARNSSSIYSRFIKFCGTLPLAIFLHNDNKIIQACHGGIEPYYSPNDFFTSGKKFDFITRNIPDLADPRGYRCVYTFGDGFQWSDLSGFISETCPHSSFRAISATNPKAFWLLNKDRGTGFMANQKDLDKYFAERSPAGKQFVKLIRAHQDSGCCCKLTNPGILDPLNWSYTDQYYADYTCHTSADKPVTTDAETRRKNRLRAEQEGLNFSAMPAGITMTSAVEAKGNINEGYAILHFNGAYASWTYQIYQNPMDRWNQERNNYANFDGNIRGYVQAGSFNTEVYDFEPSHKWTESPALAGVSEELANIIQGSSVPEPVVTVNTESYYEKLKNAILRGDEGVSTLKALIADRESTNSTDTFPTAEQFLAVATYWHSKNQWVSPMNFYIDMKGESAMSDYMFGLLSEIPDIPAQTKDVEAVFDNMKDAIDRNNTNKLMYMISNYADKIQKINWWANLGVDSRVTNPLLEYARNANEQIKKYLNRQFVNKLCDIARTNCNAVEAESSAYAGGTGAGAGAGAGSSGGASAGAADQGTPELTLQAIKNAIDACFSSNNGPENDNWQKFITLHGGNKTVKAIWDTLSPSEKPYKYLRNKYDDQTPGAFFIGAFYDDDYNIN
jgi:hypothetical protein